MPWSTILAITLGLGLIGTAVDLIRNNTNPLHDPSDDDADFDPHVVKLGRRVGGVSPFHSTEIDQ